MNPRVAAQFADLYQKVDGTNLYQVLADLAVGRAPTWVRRGGASGAAASFVLREFDGAIKVSPPRAEIAWLRASHPDACLQTFIKRGGNRRREMKWLGSYRYAAVSLGGHDREDLFRRYEAIRAGLSFEGRSRYALATTLGALRTGR